MRWRAGCCAFVLFADLVQSINRSSKVFSLEVHLSMRVCLINPPRIQPKAWGKPNVFPPIVLASVAAVLEKKHSVSIIDAPTEGWKNLVELDQTKYRVGLSSQTIAERIRQWNPDVVVVEIPFSGWSKTAFEVVSAVKAVNSKIAVVLMGLHPSARPEECLSEAEVDFVVIGEPENTVSELVDALGLGKRDFRGIDGLGYKENGKAVLAGKRGFIENLDSLPFPARHLLPMKVYNEAVKENPLRGEVSKPWTIVTTTRGCPYNCVFCSVCVLWGRTWRARSPKNVVDELEHVVKTYGVKQVDFYDENMTLDKKRMAEICDLIVERGLHIEWFTPNGVRADTLDEALAAKDEEVRMQKNPCRTRIRRTTRRQRGHRQKLRFEKSGASGCAVQESRRQSRLLLRVGLDWGNQSRHRRNHKIRLQTPQPRRRQPHIQHSHATLRNSPL